MHGFKSFSLGQISDPPGFRSGFNIIALAERTQQGLKVWRRRQQSRPAIDLANDTPFGLGSYLFTTDPDQAARVADAIQAGMVYVNIVGADSPELPFGGVKRSGSGRELGRWGADEFVNKKLIRVGA